jgi:cytochrome o ubiquinol oxidase subunit 1
MWPLAAASFAILIVATIAHTFNYDREFYVPADEVVRTEDSRTRLLASHG